MDEKDAGVRRAESGEQRAVQPKHNIKWQEARGQSEGRRCLQTIELLPPLPPLLLLRSAHLHQLGDTYIYGRVHLQQEYVPVTQPMEMVWHPRQVVRSRACGPNKTPP